MYFLRDPSEGFLNQDFEVRSSYPAVMIATLSVVKEGLKSF